VRRKYLVVILTTHILSRINITFASQHGIETLMLHESSLELSVEETPDADLSEKELSNCTPCEFNCHYGSTPNENISAINTGFMEFFDNNSPSYAQKNSNTIFARSYDIFNINHIFNENSNNTPIYINVFVKDTVLHFNSSTVKQCVNKNSGDDFEKDSNNNQNTPNFIFNLSIGNCRSNAGEVLNSFNMADINGFELANDLNGIHFGRQSAQIIDSIQLNIVDAIVDTAFADNVLVYDGADFDFACLFSKDCTSLCAGMLKGCDIDNMAYIRGRNHIFVFASSGMYSIDIFPSYHNVSCAVSGFVCMWRKLMEKRTCKCWIDFSNICRIFLPIKQINITSFKLSLAHNVYSREEKPSFNMIFDSVRGNVWKSCFLKQNCILNVFQYSFSSLKNEYAIHGTPDNSRCQKLTETLPYNANVNPNLISVVLLNKESSGGCIGLTDAFESAGKPPIFGSAESRVANENYSIFERSIVGSEDHIGAGADSYETYAGFDLAFSTGNLNALMDDAPYVNPKTPEDNYKVVPQNDTILEFSIIESSDINGLLMES